MNLTAVFTCQIAEDTSQNFFGEREITKSAICQVEADGGNGVYALHRQHLLSSIQGVTLNPGNPVCITDITGTGHIIAIGNMLLKGIIFRQIFVASKVVLRQNIAGISIPCIIVKLATSSRLIVQLIIVVRRTVSHEHHINLATAGIVVLSFVRCCIISLKLINGSSCL